MDWFGVDVPAVESGQDTAAERKWIRSLGQDDLLGVLRRRKPEMHVFGLRNDPRAVGYVLRWQTSADVVILRAEHDASAFRAPTFPGTDPFAPTLVSWQYHAEAAWTLRAMLTLAPPGHPGAPIAVERPDPLCTVPPDWRQQVTIRPG